MGLALSGVIGNKVESFIGVAALLALKGVAAPKRAVCSSTC